MRLSIKNAFFAGAIGFAALFSTIYGIVSAEEEKNYTIATGSDPLQTFDHANYGLPILQPSTPGTQQHGNINIEGTGLFEDGVGIGTENPAGILHVVGTTTIFSGSVGIGTETPATELHVIGTVTATAFEGDGSLLTGIGSSGEDTTNDSWTGTSDVYTTSGNVGIGTTSPSTELYVAGTVTADLFIGDGSGLTGIGDGNSLDALDGSPTDAVYVDNSGNVGIGTTAPSGHFHADTTTDERVGVFRYSSNSQATSDLFVISSNGGTTKNLFKVEGSAATLDDGSTRFVIEPSGNVGIGLTAPNEKLEVNGAIKVNSGGYTGVTADATTPVPSGGAGTIIFLGSDFFGWDGSAWRKLN